MVEISEERLAELEAIERASKQMFEQNPIGSKIRFYRRQRKFTMIQLAQLAGISQSYLSQAEMGIKTLSFEKLMNIAEVLSVKVSDIDPETIKRIEGINNKAKELEE